MSSSKVKKTRAGTSVHLFGAVTDFDFKTINVLPTYEQVILCYESIRVELKGDQSKEPTSNTIASAVAERLELIWQRASLPIVTHKRIVDMILSFHAKYKNIIKPMKSRHTPFLNEKLQKFKNNAKRLFDICACKCSTFQSCKCPKERKVPAIEWPFIIDQRNNRKMVIGTVDHVMTQKLQKRLKRQAKDISLGESTKEENLDLTRNTESPQPGCSGLAAITFKQEVGKGDSSSSLGTTATDDSDEEFECPKSVKSKRAKLDIDKPSSQMRISLTKTAQVADLTGISSRAVAKITTAVLEDMNIVSENDTSKVIDKSKIRREIKRNRKKLTESSVSDSKSIKGLYFDGRKDQTMVYLDGKRIVRSEEHIALVEEPDSLYLGHLSLVPPVKAADLSNGIINYLRNHNIKTEDLRVIGCDGTNVNTGWKGGVIRHLEVSMKKPLQWSICLLHANELPLRHLLQHLDGHTKGPYSFSGPIGTLLSDCELKPVVNFKIVDAELPEIDKKDLSTDQNYLLDICEAIKSGRCSDNLAKKNPGKMAHSRWLTTANRILRLYISTQNPSENFQVLVDFVMKVYAPMWFRIKSKPFIQDGARHLWNSLRLSREFPDNIKAIVYKVFENNAYFAHPENLLIAMMTDERQHIRQLAIKRILKVRKDNSTPLQSVRVFRTPKLNFNADDYIDLIYWFETNISEPPLTMDLPENHLMKIIQIEKEFQEDKLPCHTQAVERTVKIITDASKTVCGQESRDGYIRAKLEARKQLPSFENKAEYYKAKDKHKK